MSSLTAFIKMHAREAPTSTGGESMSLEDHELNIELLPKQLGDVDNTYADMEELMSDFNYKPNTNMKDGLDKFIKWYKEYYIEKE